MKLLLIFLAGFVIDLIITKYMSDVAENRIFSASFYSGLVTVANFTFLTVILRDSLSESIMGILVFAIGNCFGTYVVMRKKQKNLLLKKDLGDLSP